MEQQLFGARTPKRASGDLKQDRENNEIIYIRPGNVAISFLRRWTAKYVVQIARRRHRKQATRQPHLKHHQKAEIVQKSIQANRSQKEGIYTSVRKHNYPTLDRFARHPTRISHHLTIHKPTTSANRACQPPKHTVPTSC